MDVYDVDVAGRDLVPGAQDVPAVGRPWRLPVERTAVRGLFAVRPHLLRLGGQLDPGHVAVRMLGRGGLVQRRQDGQLVARPRRLVAAGWQRRPQHRRDRGAAVPAWLAAQELAVGGRGGCQVQPSIGAGVQRRARRDQHPVAGPHLPGRGHHRAAGVVRQQLAGPLGTVEMRVGHQHQRPVPRHLRQHRLHGARQLPRADEPRVTEIPPRVGLPIAGVGPRPGVDGDLVRLETYLRKVALVRQIEQRSIDRVDDDPRTVQAHPRGRRQRERADILDRFQPADRSCDLGVRTGRVGGAQRDRLRVPQAQPARMIKPPPKLLLACGPVHSLGEDRPLEVVGEQSHCPGLGGMVGVQRDRQPGRLRQRPDQAGQLVDGDHPLADPVVHPVGMPGDGDREQPGTGLVPQPCQRRVGHGVDDEHTGRRPPRRGGDVGQPVLHRPGRRVGQAQRPLPDATRLDHPRGGLLQRRRRARRRLRPESERAGVGEHVRACRIGGPGRGR